MCGIAEAGIVIGVISTGVQMMAQAEQQRAAQDAAEASATYNAQMAENQAAVERQQAQNEISKGIADRERQQRQAARAMGDMRANMAASGFEMDSGSNLSLLAESAGEHQYDSAIITSNSEQAAWQHEVAALNATNQGSMYNWQQANASSGRAGAQLGMAGTLLGGIGTAIGQYSKLKQSPLKEGK